MEHSNILFITYENMDEYIPRDRCYKEGKNWIIELAGKDLPITTYDIKLAEIDDKGDWNIPVADFRSIFISFRVAIRVAVFETAVQNNS
jgi:hypothetical protein